MVKYKNCVVCRRKRCANQFPSKPHAGGEEHASSTCFDCWQNHVRSQLETKEWDQIRCVQCFHCLSQPDIEKLNHSFSDKTIYKEWVQKATLASLRKHPNYVQCPSATCSYGYICCPESSEDNVFQCQVCQSRYCVPCQVPMHEGMTCVQYRDSQRPDNKKRKREIAEEEEATEQKVRKISKPCPKCRVNIEKDGGCDHMTCSRCSHQFCWDCLADYRVGRTAHKEDCRNGLRIYPPPPAPQTSRHILPARRPLSEMPHSPPLATLPRSRRAFPAPRPTLSRPVVRPPAPPQRFERTQLQSLHGRQIFPPQPRPRRR